VCFDFSSRLVKTEEICNRAAFCNLLKATAYEQLSVMKQVADMSQHKIITCNKSQANTTRSFLVAVTHVWNKLLQHVIASPSLNVLEKSSQDSSFFIFFP